MSNPENKFFDCVVCEEDVPSGRVALGYNTCLECGAKEAKRETYRKSRCVAPAFNKGAYQYVTSKSMARDLGR